MSKFSDIDLEILSAYLDGEVSQDERERIESRLAKDSELLDLFKQLQYTRAAIRSLPKLRSPRNYVLSPVMVGQVREPRQLFPVFRLATALAMVFLMLFLFGDFYLSKYPVAPAGLTMQLMQAGEQINATPFLDSELFESQAPEASLPEAIEELPAEEENQALEPSLREASPSEPLAEMGNEILTAVPTPESALGDEVEGEVQVQQVTPAPIEPEFPSVQDKTPEEVFPIGFNYLGLIRVVELVLILLIISTGFAAFYFYMKGK